MVKLTLKEMNEVNWALNNISQLLLPELGGIMRAREVTKAKEILESAMKKRQKVVQEEFKSLQEEYSHTEKEALKDAAGNFAGYEWREGVDQNEFWDKKDAIENFKVEVDLPKMSLAIGENSRINLLTVEALILWFGEDAVVSAKK